MKQDAFFFMLQLIFRHRNHIIISEFTTFALAVCSHWTHTVHYSNLFHFFAFVNRTKDRREEHMWRARLHLWYHPYLPAQIIIIKILNRPMINISAVSRQQGTYVATKSSTSNKILNSPEALEPLIWISISFFFDDVVTARWIHRIWKIISIRFHLRIDVNRHNSKNPVATQLKAHWPCPVEGL